MVTRQNCLEPLKPHTVACEQVPSVREWKDIEMKAQVDFWHSRGSESVANMLANTFPCRSIFQISLQMHYFADSFNVFSSAPPAKDHGAVVPIHVKPFVRIIHKHSPLSEISTPDLHIDPLARQEERRHREKVLLNYTHFWTCFLCAPPLPCRLQQQSSENVSVGVCCVDGSFKLQYCR